MRIILTDTITKKKRFIDDAYSFSSYQENIGEYEPTINTYVVKNKHGKELFKFGNEYTFEIENNIRQESQLTHH